MALVALALLASACGTQTDRARIGSESRAQGVGTWARLPESPLSPRRAAHAVRVGTEVFIIGGTSAPPCPPNAGCTAPEEASYRDGAALDVEHGRWRTIAEAPLPIGETMGAGVVVGDRIYMLLHGHASTHPSERAAFVVYDAGDDEWRELTYPGEEDETLTLALTRAFDTVVAYRTSQEFGYSPDLIYDPASDTWSELPKDPLAPSFDRSIVWTSHGLTLFGIENVPNPGVEPSIYRVAQFGDGRWERGPDSGIVGYDPVWTSMDGEIINMTLGRLDGGETDRWEHPYPVGGVFDPRLQEWRELVDPPEVAEPWQPQNEGLLSGVYAFSTEAARGLSHQGFVLDAALDRWYRLTPPPGAATSELAAAWAHEGLVIWGGVTWKGDDDYSEGYRLHDTGWIWTPPN